MFLLRPVRPVTDGVRHVLAPLALALAADLDVVLGTSRVASLPADQVTSVASVPAARHRHAPDDHDGCGRQVSLGDDVQEEGVHALGVMGVGGDDRDRQPADIGSRGCARECERLGVEGQPCRGAASRPRAWRYRSASRRASVSASVNMSVVSTSANGWLTVASWSGVGWDTDGTSLTSLTAMVNVAGGVQAGAIRGGDGHDQVAGVGVTGRAAERARYRGRR